MSENTRPWAPFDNRCDRCDAESWYRAEKINFDALGPSAEDEVPALYLYFCGHHGQKLESALNEQGFVVENWIHEINLAPSISANAEG